MANIRLKGGLGTLIVFGAFLIFVGYSMGGAQGGTGDWDRTEGIVTECKMTNYNEWQDGEYLTFYCPHVHYRYSVDGTVYESNAISVFNVSSTSYSIAYDSMEDYHVGDWVTVYYDPQSPSSSVLDRGENPAGVYFEVAGVLAMTVGIISVGYPYVTRRNAAGTEGEGRSPTASMMIGLAIPMAAVLFISANFFFKDDPVLYVLLMAIWAGVAALIIFFLIRGLGSNLRGHETSGMGDAGPGPSEGRGMAPTIREMLFDPELPTDMANHLGTIGLNATPLTKDDREFAEHRYMHGVLGDPIIAAVKVEGMNFDALEVWRINGQGGPGNWFLHFFIYVVRGDPGPNPKELEADLRWEVDGEGEVSDISWKGGDLADALGHDQELKDMVIRTGIPNIHVGKPRVSNYVIRSNVKLGYVAIQLLPRDGELMHDGILMRSKVGWERHDLPDRRAVELADRIAGHVRDHLGPSSQTTQRL